MSRYVSRAHAQVLVDGEGPVDPRDDAVAGFLDEMRTEFASTAAPTPRPALVARFDGHRPLHAVPDPLEAPLSTGARGRGLRALRPVAATFAAGTVLVSGLAVAGALPAPVQRTTADIGRHVGLDLPRPDTTTPARHARVGAHAGTSLAPSARSATGASGTTGADASVTGPALPPTTGVPVVTPTAVPQPTLPLPGPVPLPGTSPLAPTPQRGDRDVLRRILPEVPLPLPGP